jgi:hypothetical protein
MPSNYLIPGRLEDILVLIQVLATDHRFQIESDRMSKDLQSGPKSGGSWALERFTVGLSTLRPCRAGVPRAQPNRELL